MITKQSSFKPWETSAFVILKIETLFFHDLRKSVGIHSYLCFALADIGSDGIFCDRHFDKLFLFFFCLFLFVFSL